jgi:hypothetical protein
LRLVFSAWLGCSPFDGGRLELFGVFGGSASFASSSAMRRSASSSRCHSARINVLLGVAQLGDVGQCGHEKLESRPP